MNKLFVALLSMMFAFAPVATAVSEEVPAEKADETIEVTSEPIETIGELKDETSTEDDVVMNTRSSTIIDERFGVGSYIETKNKTYNNSLFFGGDTIIDGSNVKTGIGFFAGSKLFLTGNYEYGVHAADTMTINSSYERDLFALGNYIVVSNEASIARDVFMAANEIKISTYLHGDAMFAANKVILDNLTIDGDLRVAAKEVVFEGDVTIKGEFVYNDNLEVDGEYTAENTTTYHMPTIELKFNNMVVMCFQLAAAIAIAVVLMCIARNFFKDIREGAVSVDGNEMLTTFFTGICGAIIAPLIIALLLITIVGAPAGLLLLLAWIVLLGVSSVVTAAFIAARIMPKMNNLIGTILVLVVFAVLSLVPYLNLFVKICEVGFGFGLIFKALFSEKKA